MKIDVPGAPYRQRPNRQEVKVCDFLTLWEGPGRVRGLSAFEMKTGQIGIDVLDQLQTGLNIVASCLDDNCQVEVSRVYIVGGHLSLQLQKLLNLRGRRTVRFRGAEVSVDVKRSGSRVAL